MRTAGFLICVVFACLAAPAAWAQDYPSKPIRVIVSFPPGGGTDIAARVVGQKLTERWGQQVIIDNRGGANGNIATEIVARSTPDGYTLLVCSAGPIAINPTLYRKIPFDPVKDFAPVAVLAPTYYVLVAHPSIPANSMRELTELAKTRPGKLTFASAGVGSPGHLSAEMLKTMAGIDVVHVPYKGTGPALADLLGGQVSLMFSDMIAAAPHVSSGKLKALAMSTARRNAKMPEVPTIAESGVPEYAALGWTGLLAPAGTPKPVIEKLNREVRNILKLPDVQERLASDGSDFGNNTPQEFASFIRSEITKWGKVIKASGARAD